MLPTFSKYLRGFLLVSETAEQRHMLNTLAHFTNMEAGKSHISEPGKRQMHFVFSSILGGGCHSNDKVVVAKRLKGAEEQLSENT